MSKKTAQAASVDKKSAQYILRAVPYNRGFHFYTDVGKYTGETAIDLFAFYEELRVIETVSVRFHFQRRDFQNWFKNTLNDEELALKIDQISADLPDDKLKEELVKIVEARLTELHTKARDS